jgi:recombination protein RecA
MDYDVIVKSGGWYSYGDTKLREDELYQLLEDNPELFDEMREKIIEKIKEL